MYTLESILKVRQPEVHKLLTTYAARATEDRPEKPLTTREVEQLMAHDHYRRENGAMRQIGRRGT